MSQKPPEGRRRVAEDLMRAAGAMITLDEILRVRVLRQARAVTGAVVKRVDTQTKRVMDAFEQHVTRPVACALVRGAAHVLRLPAPENPWAEALTYSTYGGPPPPAPAPPAPIPAEEAERALEELQRIQVEGLVGPAPRGPSTEPEDEAQAAHDGG